MPQNPYQQALDGLNTTPFKLRVPQDGLTLDDLQHPSLNGGDSTDIDPNIASSLFKEKMQNDAADRMFAATRTGNVNEARALKGLLGSNTDYMNDPTDPIERSRSLGIDTQLQQHKAQLSGFENPQAAAGWQRKLEEQKVASPLDVEKARGASASDVEQQKGKSAVAVEQLKADAYGNRSLFQLMKDREDNATKEKVAGTNNQGRMGAAAIRGTSPEIGRIQEGIAAGRLNADDPNVRGSLGAFGDLLNRYTGSDNQPMDVEAHVRSLIQQHPEFRTINQFLQLVDPDGAQFETPQDKNLFIKTLSQHLAGASR